MKTDTYKNHKISQHLNNALKRLEIVTNLTEQSTKTPEHGKEDEKKIKDFPCV